MILHAYPAPSARFAFVLLGALGLNDGLRKRGTSVREPRRRSSQENSYRLYDPVRNRGKVLRRDLAIQVENLTGISTIVVIVTDAKHCLLKVRLSIGDRKELLRRYRLTPVEKSGQCEDEQD